MIQKMKKITLLALEVHRQEMLDQLSERERQVLRLRFGLDGTPVQTLDQVGQLLSCTNERVRQIQNQALRRLYRMMTANA